MREFYDDVYRFAYSLAKTEMDAADLTQQTFLRFARKGEQINDQKRVKSWLFTVLRNEFNDQQRKISRYPHVEISAHHENMETNEHPSGKIDWKTAISALQQLPLVFREPLALYYLEGHTYREIAEILRIAPGTVMSRLSRGKARLKNALKEPQ